MFWHKKKLHRPLPPGMTRQDIQTQSGICTGETVIGFRKGNTGELQQAVKVQNKREIEEFYRSYGLEPPCEN